LRDGGGEDACGVGSRREERREDRFAGAGLTIARYDFWKPGCADREADASCCSALRRRLAFLEVATTHTPETGRSSRPTRFAYCVPRVDSTCAFAQSTSVGSEGGDGKEETALDGTALDGCESMPDGLLTKSRCGGRERRTEGRCRV
jgi:hypothetical protein